jgi:hypothetical protein
METVEEFPHDIVRTMYEFLGFKNVVKGQYFLVSQSWFDTFDEYCSDMYEVDIHDASGKDAKQLISVLKVQRLLRILQKTKRFKQAEFANFIFAPRDNTLLEQLKFAKVHPPISIYDQNVRVSLQGTVDSLDLLTSLVKSFTVNFQCYTFQAVFTGGEDSLIHHFPGVENDPSLSYYNPLGQYVPLDLRKSEKNKIELDSLFTLEFEFVSNKVYVNLNGESIHKFNRIGQDYNTSSEHPHDVEITTNNILKIRSLTISYPMELLVQSEEEIDE